MNGRSHLELFTLSPPLGPGRARLRLAVALAVSGLLHAAAVWVPGPEGRSALSPPASGLEVTLRVPEPAPAGVPKTTDRAAASARGKPAAQQAPSTSMRPPGAPLLPIPASYFYGAEHLTKHPRPASRPRFDLSQIPASFTTGRVILKVWIDALGNVVAVEVETSDVPDPVSAGAARAFRELSFIPGEIRGRRVASVMRIEVLYLEGKRMIQVIGAPR